ncbi:5,6-dimethylbenzimidazole synthase [Calidifontibacter indicus]|uniref:Cob(II)yrinic acid a,c-diamide reductase n=1 Tax=Calidifontibacter indicus TaxID=419650 RepID=A0A3D9UJ58_9MICO|nr:5,6-dimethylbenzimidazole synthase [Calidifontibacter indicus]REF29478.1 cob(II)yrinic acid a,c-diamide reductase [Calidifontibacter indicus]
MSEQSAPQRPVPLVGDPTSAQQRRDDPAGWAMPPEVVDALAAVVGGRRDIRRFRPDPVPDELLRQVLEAAHSAPSVGHSQPWRFIVVRSQTTRDRAAHLADRARLEQASELTSERAARLLDLKLEGLREAPVGVVVTCDRRTPAAGVLGRATFPDADLWSCACAVQNLWLTARALGLGVGWVTLFDQAELADLLHLPDGVVTLGWLCVGWPDERPPAPGLERAAWSRKAPLDDVVLQERWPHDSAPPAPPTSHLRGPAPGRRVDGTDDTDRLLSPPEALGALDRALNLVRAAAGPDLDTGTLVLVGADHPVTAHAVSAYDRSVTRDVLTSAVGGGSLGAAHARAAGLDVVVVDAGVGEAHVEGAVDVRPHDPRGDLVTTDAMSAADVRRLMDAGRRLGAGLPGLVALGEVGVGNTTVAAALTCALTGAAAADVVGLGSGADADIVARKTEVVAAAIDRLGDTDDVHRMLAAVGGPEFAVLTGVVLGAAGAGRPVVLDGLATSVAALAAVGIEPSVQAYLIAGQRSREKAHGLVLRRLGLEPLLQLRLRAGEGVGACLAAGMVLQGMAARRTTVRTSARTAQRNA